MSKPKVQIIIPVINLWEKYTKQCIDSVIKACDNIDYRILLIDNCSTDETITEAGKLVSSLFAHKRNEERWGVAQSWNYGVRDAFERGYEYVLILNNDILIHKDSIDKIIERFEKENSSENIVNNEIAMITMMDIRGECPEPTNLFDKNSEDYKEVPESEHPNYSAFMINKKYWDIVGKFDEGFKPAYFEDNDSHYRMKLAGLKAIVLPTALFYHYGSRTQNESAHSMPVVKGIQFEKNRQYFAQKWGGVPGQEKFTTPFNDNTKDTKWCFQSK